MSRILLIAPLLLLIVTSSLACSDDIFGITDLQQRAARAETKVAELQQQLTDLQLQLDAKAQEVVEIQRKRTVEVIKEIPVGVSQAEYDKVVNELATANAKIKSLESQLNSLKTPAPEPSPSPSLSPTPTPKPPPITSTSTTPDPSTIQPATQSTATITSQYKWNYGGFEWMYTANIPQALYDYYVGLPRPPTHNYSVYVTHPSDDPYIVSLVETFKDTATQNGFNKIQTINFAVSFVQSLPYTVDDVTKGYDEYPRYPIETLVDNGGDCEDTSILMAAILQEMGYGTILISPPNHMAVGILGGERMYGTYWELKGGKYYYLETTGKGRQIGELPSEYQGAKANVYELIPVPILTLEWEATETHYSFPQWYVKLDIKVDNLGTATARGLYARGSFDAGSSKVWNSEDSPTFDLAPGYSQVTMYVAIPMDKHTRLIVTVVQDGFAILRSYSDWLDT